jgi:hypothetical protein
MRNKSRVTTALICFIIALIPGLLINGCYSHDSRSQLSGKAVVWSQSMFGCKTISIYLTRIPEDGILLPLIVYGGHLYDTLSSPPSCGATRSVTFTLPVGTYGYTTDCNAKKWSGIVNVNAGDCSQIELLKNPITTGQVCILV